MVGGMILPHNINFNKLITFSATCSYKQSSSSDRHFQQTHTNSCRKPTMVWQTQHLQNKQAGPCCQVHSVIVSRMSYC